MNIYFACGLTHVPRDRFHGYVAFIHRVVENLSSEHGVFVRYALRDSDPQLANKPIEDRARFCYQWDREMVEWADVLIADATYPSTGLGIELQIAEGRNIPIVLCFNRDGFNRAEPIDYETPDHLKHSLQLGQGYITLMALGLPGLYKVIPYSSDDEVYSGLTGVIGLLGNKR
jgi:hypothetical protein